jgi:branched-chain amino acid transport system ATP-binding protein
MADKLPLLGARGLTKRFGGLTAVDSVDFDLYPGEILGLIGPNGAGKSTTFNLIAGVYAPTAGTVVYEGREIQGLQPHRVAALGIMRTFQHNMPFEGMTLVDNVLVGAHTKFHANPVSVLFGLGGAGVQESTARAKAEEMIDFVGLSEERETDVMNLSFGQGRLLECARALAAEPKVIMFDEPAAGLTPAECDRLSEIIRGIAARGISVLLIEHDMHFLLPLVERAVVLNFGAKIADGPAKAIQSDPAVVAAYLGEPMGVEDAAGGA